MMHGYETFFSYAAFTLRYEATSK